MNALSFRAVTAVFVALVLLFGLSGCSRKADPEADSKVSHYTCTMHPSVRLQDPKAKCPICAMDLVPVMKEAANEAAEPPAGGHVEGSTIFAVPVERQQQIGVTYATVERAPLAHTIRAVGIVEPDATRRWTFVARIAGYVQQLFVTSPGQIVEKDQPLLSIYSPDLQTTQRELVMLLRMRDEARTNEARETPNRLIAAAKARLQQWNVTEQQIAELQRSRTPTEFLTLRSPFRGVVQRVPPGQGASVSVGDVLVEVADLSVVWGSAEFYENELSVLKPGQKFTLTSASYPDEKFEGELAVVNPFVDPVKRTAKVRIDVANPDFKLQPGMFVNAELAMNMGEGLTIPVSAVMPTGTRNIVFIDKGEGKLEPRLVELGTKYGDRYEVRSGLEAGDRVVASANFLIDAEAKVQGALKTFDQPAASPEPQ
jgi:membrane fusion protein, copper/silver efflux system